MKWFIRVSTGWGENTHYFTSERAFEATLSFYHKQSNITIRDFGPLW